MSSVVTLTMNPSVDLVAETDRMDLSGAKTRSAEPSCYPGGGGINVARGIAALGGEVLAVYPSGGEIGQQLDRLVTEAGIEHRVTRIGGYTRQNVSLRERPDGRHLHLVFPGPRLGADEWRACADAVAGIEPPPDYLVMSGSLPPGVPADFYAQLAGRCAERGSRVMVDTSGPALEAVLEAGVYLLKPNRREFARLFDLSADGQEGYVPRMRELVERGAAEAVVVTIGEAGALLATAERCVHVRPPDTPGRNPVGAGDSLVAGLVAGLAAGNDLVEALAQGVAAAAAAVKEGGDLYRVDDLESIRGRVRVEDCAHRT